MILRIFKKDWTLLWPLVAVVAAMHAINAVIWLVSGFFGIRELMPIANIFPAGVLLGTGALVVAIVHQDVLPGDRQDWLVRPIPRVIWFWKSFCSSWLPSTAPSCWWSWSIAWPWAFPSRTPFRPR